MKLSTRTLVALFASALVPAFAQTPAAAPKADAPPAGAARPLQLANVPATDPKDLKIAPGFKVELVYTVPKADQGSWVALTLDPKGRMIAGDQYGGLYRLTLPRLGSTEEAKVERLNVVLSDPARPFTPPAGGRAQKGPPPRIDVGAHGLLYAFGSLYVMNNERPDYRGLWRLRDTDGDDQFDKVELLREMKGSGEHGTHSLVLSPDGKSIYFANGNHTDLPIAMETSRPVKWGEDHLLPRMWDARGHARDKLAPGGYVARTDPDGKSIDLFAMGYRNQFDIAFDQNGELFTYDSDMEWDQGSPWYMPTRINHIVNGGDYGWRSGAGRWPAYYADSLPAVVDIGPGSPTGTTFGTRAKFPAKYQRALYAADWTFGTLYAIHMTPDGATFRGEKEEFVSGKPLSLTDVMINPNDGAMYFAVGGRRNQSALYRVTYAGNESTAAVGALPPTPEAKLRRSLEELHADGTGPGAIDTSWQHLGSPDRFVRWAARVAIERQPATLWADRALGEIRPQAAIEALIALARVGDKALQPRLIKALEQIDFAKQPAALRLPLLRAWELAFTRMGKPDAETSARLAARFDPLFPHADAMVNRELVSLLIYLGSPNIVAKTVALMRVPEPVGTAPEEQATKDLLARNDNYGRVVKSVVDSRPDRQQIAFAYALRNATVGWTPKLHADFFSWFAGTGNWKGGASFTGFLANIRTESLANVTDPGERAALVNLTKQPPPAVVANAVQAKGPGRAYTVAEAVAIIGTKPTGRDFEQGKAMFTATACIMCHRFNGDGNLIGPDLTGAGSRYSVRDLLENIIDPSLVISDQYGAEIFELNDGNQTVGRAMGESNGELQLMTNPFVPSEVSRVKLTNIKARRPSPTSMMPPYLIYSLNPEELKDLVAYILSGGNATDAMFKK